jgi:hypothetical protein
MASMSGGQPTKDQFEKFLRDLERIQAKLADADNQFLASATELVAESRRGGMQRVRRELQAGQLPVCIRPRRSDVSDHEHLV